MQMKRHFLGFGPHYSHITTKQMTSGCSFKRNVATSETISPSHWPSPSFHYPLQRQKHVI